MHDVLAYEEYFVLFALLGACLSATIAYGCVSLRADFLLS